MLGCMRTTVRLDENLLTEAKRLAIDTGRTLTQVIEDSLRMSLANRKTIENRKPIKLHTSKGGNGLQPGVDLSNNAALQDLMDEYDGLFRR
jgi:post-segregation antitoxin (ccd killing protein)